MDYFCFYEAGDSWWPDMLEPILIYSGNRKLDRHCCIAQVEITCGGAKISTGDNQREARSKCMIFKHPDTRVFLRANAAPWNRPSQARTARSGWKPTGPRCWTRTAPKKITLDFVVASASDGLECLALLDSFKPDLIVMDVMMPHIDGNETTRRIRRLPEWRTIPIIAVTASASREDELACREAGVDAFLAKPVDYDVLLGAIGTQLSLNWNTGQAPLEPGASDDDEGVDLVIPPAREIEALWQLARIGNMRLIRDQADYLEALDPAYAPFAQRLQALAQGYHSKALVAFVAHYRANDTLPPLRHIPA